jgi:hypothetical protein
MPKLRHGQPFLYDDDSEDIVGLRDIDGSELYLVPHTGTWYDLDDQTAAADTRTLMTFDTVGFERGITLSNSTRLNISRRATYNVQFSAMFSNPEAAAYAVSVWLSVNGVDAPDSCTDITVPAKHGQANGKAVAAWNFFVDLNPRDYVELVWSTPYATVFIEHAHARTGPVRPAVPSVILTINEINGQRR